MEWKLKQIKYELTALIYIFIFLVEINREMYLDLYFGKIVSYSEGSF